MALALSTRATKLQYSQHEYWVEVALRVDENGTCTRRKWHFGWAKVALAHQKTTFLWFSRRTAMAKRCCLLCFFLQNGCSGRGCLNNICIASYRVGAKFFTTNLMSVDLPLNTPKTRKPIAERTSHRWLGCAVLTQNTQNWAAWVWQGCHTLLICEHPCHLWEALLCQKVPCVRSAGISFLPQMARMNTDGWGALFSHRIYRIWQRGYSRDAIPS